MLAERPFWIPTPLPALNARKRAKFCEVIKILAGRYDGTIEKVQDADPAGNAQIISYFPTEQKGNEFLNCNFFQESMAAPNFFFCSFPVPPPLLLPYYVGVVPKVLDEYYGFQKDLVFMPRASAREQRFVCAVQDEKTADQFFDRVGATAWDCLELAKKEVNSVKYIKDIVREGHSMMRKQKAPEFNH